MRGPDRVFPTGQEGEEGQADTPDVELRSVISPSPRWVLEGVHDLGAVVGRTTATCRQAGFGQGEMGGQTKV